MLWPPLVYATAGDMGGSAFHRVITPLNFANSAGVIQLRTPMPIYILVDIEYIKAMKPDAILFHRSHTEPQIKYIKNCKNNTDALIVYTIDDWVEKVPKYSPHFKDVPPTVGKDIRKALAQCDRLIASTDIVANAYSMSHLEITVIPNYLSYTLWSQIYNNNIIKRNRFGIKPRIGWAGAMGHSADTDIFYEIAQELGDEVQWVFIDSGEIPKGFNHSNAEIHPTGLPKDFPLKYYSLGLDLALCPLIDNDFNRARTNLKVLENGACGYASIASDMHTFRDCPVTKVRFDVKEWVKAIRDKLSNLDKLYEEGQKLKEWVWTNYKLEDHVNEYSQVLSPDRKGFIPQLVNNDALDNTIDIIVTTRNNKEVVERCLNSVFESIPQNQTPIEIIVSDNASNESNMKSYLEGIKDKVILNKQSTDVGYIKNVNSAIALHENRDVIILNSDTIVNGDWVDRLRDLAYENGENNRVASVTPLSNNATVNSYPDPKGSLLSPPLVKVYDGLAKKIIHPQIPLVTPIGFCTFIRRNALADLGLFDSHAFGRGYGEENDWAMRGNVRNWRHIVGYNTYIGHENSSTFGQEKTKLLESANRVLSTRWQQYFQAIDQWNQNNPLNSVKQLLDLYTIESTSHHDRTLYITHNLGGGIETFLQNELAHNKNSIILRNNTTTNLAKIEFPHEEYFFLPSINLKQINLEYLSRLFKTFRISHINIQSTVSYDYNIPYWIMNLSELMGINYSLQIHDYYSICPRIKLTSKEYYCGEPDELSCNHCVKTNGSWIGQVDVGVWRDMYHQLLKSAAQVIAPSHDAINRLTKYFPDISIDYKPHEASISIESASPIELQENEPVKVAIIGFIFPEKGSLLVKELSEYCVKNNINLKFIVFGNLVDTRLSFIQPIQGNKCLEILGNYEEENLPSLLNQHKCHISFFPNLWPETYSYTLSHAFRNGLFPIAFDIGAIAERVKETKFGITIPFDERNNYEFIVNTILEQVDKLKG